MSYKSELKAKYYPEEYSLTPDFSRVTLKLELTNACNHRCLTCPNSKQPRPARFMKEELAARLIREAAELHVGKIALFLNGEPFLVPNIQDYVLQCSRLNIPYIFLTTNGSIATRAQLAGVMDAGLSSLKFSINAPNAETYRTVHGRDDFAAVMENLRFARQYRDEHALPCRILAGCVLTDHTKGLLDVYEARIGPLVDDLLFLKPDNFGGYMVRELASIYRDDGVHDPRVYYFEDKRSPCPLVFNSANVTSEGYLTLCCSEALNYMVLEDLNRMSLQEAWNSPRMKAIRRRHLENDLKGTQCYNCIHNVEEKAEPLNRELFLASRNGRG